MNASLPAKIRIAVGQTPGTLIDSWKETRVWIDNMIARAAREGAELAVLPECVWPAYYIESIECYFKARADGMPGPVEFLDGIRAAARREHLAVCLGYVAECDRDLSNRVALVDAAGELLGTHDKCFLWDFDNDFYQPGTRLTPISTPWGPIGLMICADARLPEIPATLVARGARLLLQPTAWVNVGTPADPWNPQPTILIPDRAREFGVPIASASKWGAEGPINFVGSSLICATGGRVLSQCGYQETSVIVAEVELLETAGSHVSPEERNRLLSPVPARPPSADVPKLRVIRPRSLVARQAPIERPRHSEAGVQNLPMLEIADAAGQEWPGTDDRLFVSGPLKQSRSLRGINIASISDGDARRFAPLRVFALEGVHAAVVFGDRVAAGTLRTRAAENRIYIIHVTSNATALYSPMGIELAPLEDSTSASCDSEVFLLDAALAARKEFAPRTDPFRQRRPADYDFDRIRISERR